MKLPLLKTKFTPAVMLSLVLITSLACNLLSQYASRDASPIASEQPTLVSPTVTIAVKPTDTPAQARGTATATVEAATAGQYTLAVSERYLFFEEKINIGISLAARAGQLWVGTVTGTFEEVDPEDGTYGQSVALVPQSTAIMPTVYPIHKMAFEGDYLWAFAGPSSGSENPPQLVALDPDSGEIVHQWDSNSPEWMRDYERGFASEEFGVSPGKIWIDSHIVETQTFEVTLVPMPGMTLFAYDGGDWMWITGEMGGACDDMILINVNDPSIEWCEDDWPFFTHAADGIHPMGLGSPMVVTEDKMWMAGGWPGESLGDMPYYLLEAYPADIDEAMKTTGPLVSVPLLDDDSNVLMLFAGDYLWLVYTGDKAGWLYQLDPQTGETINSLDLVGDAARAISDIPQDIATEGDNLWILTSRQLLRIKLP